jgi:hypothetical protein
VKPDGGGTVDVPSPVVIVAAVKTTDVVVMVLVTVVRRVCVCVCLHVLSDRERLMVVVTVAQKLSLVIVLPGMVEVTVGWTVVWSVLVRVTVVEVEEVGTGLTERKPRSVVQTSLVTATTLGLANIIGTRANKETNLKSMMK